MSNLTDNTAALNSLLEKVNSLPDAGEDMPEVELATPQISVAATGKITASITQEAGKVAGGTKTATLEQSTLAAKTYTPGTTDQTIRAYLYLTGNQIIKGDANLIPANIVKGKTIFGVDGSAEAGGGSAAVETCEVYLEIQLMSGTTFFTSEINGGLVPDWFHGYTADTFIVLKNSMIVVTSQSWQSYNADGDVELVQQSEDYNGLAFWVSGNGSIFVY